MDLIGNTISNFIASQFPATYRENGPMLVQFCTEYFKWLESKVVARDEYINPRFSHVKTAINSANIVGTGTIFTTLFEDGDQIVICKDEQSDDFDFFTIKSVANNTFITLTPNKIPDFSMDEAKYTTVSERPNALFLTRNFFDIQDIDDTFDEYVVYFKEKYLKGLQFKTITDTKTLVKHSLDLYRSKGTERSVDLLYKIVFGKPASVYYPGRDLFRLSSGDWFIPTYLELSLSPANKRLINRQVIGTRSGAKAFVQEIIRRVVNQKIVEIAYISAINGNFVTGEKVILADNSLAIEDAPTIIGSMNSIEVDITGAGLGFSLNEIVDVSSSGGIGGKAKVTSTANTEGQVFFSLADGGYGYSNSIMLSNTTGNVSVTAACSVITGTGTLFDTEYSNGDYISVWADTEDYETHRIIEIANSTEVTVDAVFGFSNGETKASFTRYFAQTFVSDYILHLANVTIDSAYNNYEYFEFLDTLTEPMALLNYENANGTFVVGNMIYSYSPAGSAKVLSVNKKTATAGTLTVSLYSGDVEADAIYTTGNTIGANLAVANGYTDITATAKVIGNYANVIVSCNTVDGEFTIGEHLIQLSSGAHGNIAAVFTQGSNVIINVTDSIGIFKSGMEIEEEQIVVGANSGATARVISIDIYAGIVSVNNAFLAYDGNWVSTPYLQGVVDSVSRGYGAYVTFANNILFTEDITFNTDEIHPYLDLELAETWPFPAYPTANLDTIIYDCLSYEDLTIGKVSAIISSTPGNDYNSVPIIRLHEPLTFRFNYPDTVVLEVTSTVGLSEWELLTQTSTNARGLIKKIEDPYLYVQNLRFWANDMFTTTSGETSKIVGTNSGMITNVVSVATVSDSPRFGSDITTDQDLVIGEGAITSLQVLDSGFGFTNGELVTITSGNNTAQGYAVDNTHGTGTGYYKSRDGFLSDTKKLSDGYYWQEYSYEVRSGVVSEFKSILRSIIHVAGTGYFDKLIYDSINTTTPGVERILTQT